MTVGMLPQAGSEEHDSSNAQVIPEPSPSPRGGWTISSRVTWMIVGLVMASTASQLPLRDGAGSGFDSLQVHHDSYGSQKFRSGGYE